MIEFRHTGIAFSGVKVLDDISFSIRKGTLTAIMGENGAGKSTLMKILAGIYAPGEGSVLVEGTPVPSGDMEALRNMGIAMIHQELNLVPDLSISGNILLGSEPVNRLGMIQQKSMHAACESLLREFKFPCTGETEVSTLSTGWQQMTEIAAAIYRNARILIMDEPTSSLSEQEKDILFGKIREMKKEGKTILYISHKMSEIHEIADEVVIMRDGKFVGQYPINTLSREELIRRMTGKEPVNYVIAERKEKKEIILSSDGLEVKIKDKIILKDIRFDLHAGEIIGVAGLLGSGRSRLLRLIYGAYPAKISAGTLLLNGSVYTPNGIAHARKYGIAYLSEDRKLDGIFSGLSLLENTCAPLPPSFMQAGFISRKNEITYTRQTLKQLNTRYASLDQPVQSLSGGNQQKALLARTLLHQPKLILLDEPSRGVDVGAREEIYNLIRELRGKGIAFMICSSEISELQQLSDKILVMSAGRQSACFDAGADASSILQSAFKYL